MEAFSANENGRLMIGDEIINVEKISNYKELLELGRAPVDEEPVGLYDVSEKDTMIPAEMKLKAAPGKYHRTYAQFITPGAWWFEKKTMGNDQYRHSSGWRTYGSRKIKVNFSRETRTNYIIGFLPGGFRLEWHLEVSFRKKGFLGFWYNYSSKSETSVNIEYYDSDGNYTGKIDRLRLFASGTSSHDLWARAYVIRHIKPDSDDFWSNIFDYYSQERKYPRCVYEMPFYWAEFSVRHQGISQEIRLAFSAPTLYGYTNYISDKLE